MQAILRLACVAACAALAFTPAPSFAEDVYPQALSERASGQFDVQAYAQKQANLHRRLVAAQAAPELRVPVKVAVSEEALAEVEARNPFERRVRVGVAQPLGLGVSFEDLSIDKVGASGQALLFGAARKAGDRLIWTGSVESPGAHAIRLHLTEMSLPAGVALYVYNEAGEAFGPFTKRGPRGSGEFWTNTVAGSSITLQLETRGQIDAAKLRSIHFVVEEVGHLTARFQVPNYLGTQVDRPATLLNKSFCSFNASCVENANCGGTSSAVNDARNGVAHMQYRSGGFIYICSGGLLADTDGSSQIPYFLTANHCLSKGREASSLETFWQFDTPCGASCYNPDGVVPRVLGSSIVSTNRTSDYTLLRLDSAPPAGSVYLGWTSAPVAFANGTNLYRVSHPGGAPQAYSEHRVDTSKGTCSSWPRGNWIYSQDLYGATEGGSSGSPVVNGAGQVVGQLSGACGTNVNDSCDSGSNATVDGALAAYFDEVSQYLDPDTGGPGGCLDAGESCSSGGQCCSGRCRGRGGNKTCQ